MDRYRQRAEQEGAAAQEELQLARQGCRRDMEALHEVHAAVNHAGLELHRRAGRVPGRSAGHTFEPYPGQAQQATKSQFDEGVSFAKLVHEETLDFSECNLVNRDLAGLNALVTHAEMKVKRRSLRLDGNTLVTAQAWEQKLPKVVVNGSLTSLNLSESSLGPEGGAAVAEALKVKSSLTSLYVGRNKIGDEGTKAMAAALAVNISLTSLDLGYNNIGDEGAKAIGAALPVNGSLTILYLGYNEIGDEGAKAIGAALAVNVSLTSLTLVSNIIDQEGEALLKDAAHARLTLYFANTAD